MEFAGAFLEAFLDLWQRGPVSPPADAELEARIAAVMCPLAGPLGEALPPGAFQVYLSGWIRLYGLVAMEVFGHLRWAVTDAEPIFEAELADYLGRLTGR